MSKNRILPSFPPTPEHPENGGSTGVTLNQSWMITYLDTFTLLLGFFIILSSVSDYRLMVMPLRNAEGDTAVSPEFRSAREVMEDAMLTSLNNDLVGLLRSDIETGVMRLERFPHEIKLSYRGSSFFESGSAALLDEGRQIILRTYDALISLESNQFFLDIEGHTDSLPIRSEVFPTNWELSTARAATIVRFFLDMGFPKTSLKASGYADTFLLVADYDQQGRAIPSNNDMNRRIVFRIYTSRSYLDDIIQD
jgi:chemotaxis protein MotB